jgi:hypothetical protein
VINALRTLEDAISDVGMWSWWVPGEDFFQVEFAGTQLFNLPATPDAPPSGQVALKFIKPSIIAFLTHPKGLEMPEDWPEKLHKDELKPFNITYSELTLTDPEIVKQIFGMSARTLQLLGCGLDDIPKDAAMLAFWAGPVGLVVIAEQMEIFSHQRQLKLEEIPELSRKWWAYWKEYWRRRDNENRFPVDYACEVTIPAERSDEPDDT